MSLPEPPEADNGARPAPTLPYKAAPLISGGAMALIGLLLIGLVIVINILNVIPGLWNLLLLAVGIALILTAAGAVTHVVVSRKGYAITLAGASAIVALILWGVTKIDNNQYAVVSVDVPNFQLPLYHVSVSVAGYSVLSAQIAEPQGAQKSRSFKFVLFQNEASLGTRIAINLALDSEAATEMKPEDLKKLPKEIGFYCIPVREVSNIFGINEPLRWMIDVDSLQLKSESLAGHLIDDGAPDCSKGVKLKVLKSNTWQRFVQWLNMSVMAAESPLPLDENKTYDQLGSLISNVRENARSALVRQHAAAIPMMWRFILRANADYKKSGGDSSNYHRLVGILFVANQILEESQSNITKFRERPGGITPIVLALADLANNPDRTMRLRSTQVLANVLDNRDLPLIVKQAKETKNSIAQSNLLLAVGQVAGYACKQNVEMIQKELGDAKFKAASKFAPLIDSTLSRANASPNRNTQCLAR